MAKLAVVTKLAYLLPIYKLDKTGKNDKTDKTILKHYQRLNGLDIARGTTDPGY